MIDRSEARILALVAYSPGVSRIDLQARLDLPATTVTSAVGRLLRRGEIIEEADHTRRPSPGRRPSLLHPAAGPRLLGFVSWSHARVRAVLCDFAGQELQACQYPVTEEDPLAGPMAELAGTAAPS
jgi:MarR family